MSNDFVKKSFWGTYWSLIESLANYLLTFIIGVILARLLSPSDFGLIGMLTVFIGMSNVFIESGFSNALIRKTDRTVDDCSTAFYFNILVGVVCYISLFLTSPYIASFFSEPFLEELLKILAINVLVNSLCIVPNALLISSLNIKRITQINIFVRFFIGAISILLAYSGWGVWALVFQSVAGNALRCIAFWISAKWLPIKRFSVNSFKYLWSFGSKMLLTGIISSFFNDIYNLLLGKFSTKESLGYYTRANQFSGLIPSVFTSIIQKIAIPTLAEFQQDISKLKSYYRQYMHLISFFVFPLMFTAGALAEPIILLLLSDKWFNSIILFQILCLGQAFAPLGILNLCLLQVVNRTDYTLKLEIYKKILLAVIVVITIPKGLLFIVAGQAIYHIIATFINFESSKKILSYNYTEQIVDILKYFLIALFASFIVYFINSFISNEWLKILIGGSMGIITYLGISVVFKLEAVTILYGLREKLKK